MVWINSPVISLPTATIVEGGYFTNTTYAALSMLQGDAFSKKFGGASGNDPDWFVLNITGHNGQTTTGQVDFHLADYRFSDNSQDFILDQWTWVDLSSLGAVTDLSFSFDSSDVGSFGVNTPVYFALDHLTVQTIPEPTSACLLITSGVMVIRRKRSWV